MILALAGGVGGAKLAHGLARVLAPGDLTIAVNTGDDFEHLGLHISPDLDSVMYKLAGINNTETGWGVAGESWQFMAALERLGAETWFRLGDHDMATHVVRTEGLAAGKSLSRVTADLCACLGIRYTIAPMSDDPVRTLVETDGGRLAFQHYFVRDKCEPRITGFHFEGQLEAAPSPALAAALADPDLGAIILCPSNPFISMDPILGIPAVKVALAARAVPMVAVSPIIDGKAVKGPAAKMMAELGLAATAAGIAGHYGGLLDGFILDRVDTPLAPEIAAGGIRVATGKTLMESAADEERLAELALELAAGDAMG